jgi:hypothetical protein
MHRQLAIERVVTPANTVASYIRLRGAWLREHGFEPGQRVAVRLLGTGILELRAAGTADSSEQSGTVLEIEQSASLAANVHTLIKNGMLR